MIAPAAAPKRNRLGLLALLGLALWTLGACAVADYWLHDTWTYSCTTDTECEYEDEVRAKAEGRR